MQDIVAALKTKQGGTTQAEFARRLGVSEALLSLVYAGRRRIGEEMARRIVRAYPDLLWVATAYVMGKDGEDAGESATTG